MIQRKENYIVYFLSAINVILSIGYAWMLIFNFHPEKLNKQIAFSKYVDGIGWVLISLSTSILVIFRNKVDLFKFGEADTYNYNSISSHICLALAYVGGAIITYLFLTEIYEVF